MVAVNSKYLEVFNAKQFKESVSEPSSSNLYFTYGQAVAWANEAAPPQANTSVAAFNEVWANMQGGKKITGNDIRHVVPRFTWSSGTVYNYYDHMTESKELKSANNKFYVVTDSWNVYKCLANNNGKASTVKPTSIITTSDFQTVDGYVWKYMYTLTAQEQERFTTTTFMPVKTLSVDDGSLQWLVQNNAISGAIHNLVLTNFGSGYTANNIYITITGDGQDANAYAVRNVTTNTISSIVVDNKGIDYTYASVTIQAANGSGATARAIISPQGGHGSDPLTELGGSYLLINTLIENTESGQLSVANDYRQISILEDPLVYASSNVAANSVVSQVIAVTLNGSSNEFIEDEWVYQGGNLASATFKGIVVEWDAVNNIIYLSNVEGSSTSDLLIGDTSGAARYLIAVSTPDLQPLTGKLLYIDNITPIQRAVDQTEDFKIVLSF